MCHCVVVSSFQGSQHSGSSLSLASTKVCSSMDEGDGPGSEGKTKTVGKDCKHVLTYHIYISIGIG